MACQTRERGNGGDFASCDARPAAHHEDVFLLIYILQPLLWYFLHWHGQLFNMAGGLRDPLDEGSGHVDFAHIFTYYTHRVAGHYTQVMRHMVLSDPLFF